MTQAIDNPQPVQLVREALSLVALRRRAVARAAMLERAAATGLVAVLALALLDALWPMAPGFRLVLSLGFYAAAAWLLVRCARAGYAETSGGASGGGGGGDWREARRLEQSLHLSSNPLLNALGLAPLAAGSGNGLPEELSRRAVVNGCRAAAGIDLHAAVDHRPLRRELARLGLAVLLTLAAVTLQFRLFTGGAARLFDPFGDHPPFSLTHFELTATPGEPLSGGDVLVQARLSGKIPPQAELVELDSHGREARRWPMTPAPAPGSTVAASGSAAAANGPAALFTRRLQSLREPVVVRVEAATGYSHRLTIVPRRPPSSVAAAQPPNGANPANPNNSFVNTTQPSGGGGEAGDNAAAVRSTLARLAAMAEAARRIQAISAELSARLQALGGDNSLPDWLRDQLKLLQQRLDTQAASGRTLAQQMDDLANAAAAAGSGVDPSLVRFLKLAAKDLAALGLPQQPGLGLGGGEGLTPPQLAELLAKLAEAAGLDARKLEEQLAKLDALGGSSTGSGEGGTAVTTQPSGAGVEVVDTPGTTLSHTDALVQSAPPGYRELVRRYYERLLRDQQKSGE